MWKYRLQEPTASFPNITHPPVLNCQGKGGGGGGYEYLPHTNTHFGSSSLLPAGGAGVGISDRRRPLKFPAIILTMYRLIFCCSGKVGRKLKGGREQDAEFERLRFPGLGSRREENQLGFLLEQETAEEMESVPLALGEFML